MIKLSTLPAPATFAVTRPPESPVGATSDFGHLLATIAVPKESAVSVQPPLGIDRPVIDRVLPSDALETRQPLAADGTILPYAAIQVRSGPAIGTGISPAIDWPTILADEPPFGQPVKLPQSESPFPAAELATPEIDAMLAPPPAWIAEDAGPLPQA